MRNTSSWNPTLKEFTSMLPEMQTETSASSIKLLDEERDRVFRPKLPKERCVSFYSNSRHLKTGKVKMRSEPIHIPVIMHTNSLISNFNVLPFDSDSAYDSKSDSENSEPLLDVLGSGNIDGKAGTCRSIQCRWIDCGKTFSFLDDLAAHVTSFHANSGPGGLFFCGWEGCNRGNRGFNARYKMLVHVRTHTNEKPHRCFQCDKSFSRAENLKIHARSHTGEKPYVCPVPGCGKAYSNSSDRFKHTRTHSVDKPYVCKVPGCGKRYTDPSSLRKHVKTYRHFSPNQTAVEVPTKDMSSTVKIDEDLDHEQIVPETVKNMEPVLKRCSDPSDINYYYNVDSDRVVSFQIFKNWFDKDHFRWYPEEAESYWNGYYDVQEQDMPLDLTVHK